MSLNERSIVHDTETHWVMADQRNKQYVVYIHGATHSKADSAYPLTMDGLSIAKARCDYLSRTDRKVSYWQGTHA